MNCGPGALCGILNMSPDQVKPYLPDFERKKYTTDKMMARALEAIGVPFTRLFDDLDATGQDKPPLPSRGLVRIQWSGPWVGTDKQYRHTHWVAVSQNRVFDFNAISVGGWISWKQWQEKLIPWLLEECEPQWTGKWWATNCWEIDHGPK